jgi:hypothetical protein
MEFMHKNYLPLSFVLFCFILLNGDSLILLATFAFGDFEVLGML